jgi:hypothetical protein
VERINYEHKKQKILQKLKDPKKILIVYNGNIVSVLVVVMLSQSYVRKFTFVELGGATCHVQAALHSSSSSSCQQLLAAARYC